MSYHWVSHQARSETSGMAQLYWRWALPLFYTCITLQALLGWSCGSAQRPGFLSIDCGSDSSNNFTDDFDSIQWMSDANLMKEGESITLGAQIAAPYNTMRLFTGNLSKYCYTLSNPAVQSGAYFLVRAWFSVSFDTQLPYQPTDSNNFHFKLLIDADEWTDVYIPKNLSITAIYEIYTRALRNSIDVCVARSATAEGDAPFISALELRPLPSSLSATVLMNSTSRRFISQLHIDYGVADTIFVELMPYLRYPSDLLDRLWIKETSTPALNTTSDINTTTDPDMLPASILQTAFGGTTERDIYLSYPGWDVNHDYYGVIYFAEIDPAVNASGQRVFNISWNGQAATVNSTPNIDVFAEVGAYAAYEIAIGPLKPTHQGDIFFNFSATTTSIFPPFFAASELFQASINTSSAGSSPIDVSAIEDLKTSMNLSSYSGDPCLPEGFGYAWLKCEVDSTLKGYANIKSINLSSYFTGGEIPETINTLTMLEQILLNNNNLVGSIPDMSALANLQTLDLSNNKLNGSIPESLARLEKLKVLNLENNNLTGEIPLALLKKKEASTLQFEFPGNLLCQTNSGVACTSSSSSSSKSKNNTRLIIGVGISTLLVVIIGIGVTIFCLCKKKNILAHESLENHLSAQQEIPLYETSYPSSSM